jgi:probable lipoprotein NlpC
MFKGDEAGKFAIHCIRMNKPRVFASILLLALAAAWAYAEAPVDVVAPKKARERIVDQALAYSGAPYAFGGNDERGFDCSGLVYRVFLRAVGASLPRTARAQYDFREPIDRGKLQPGDLLFFNTTGPISHVGIYEGEGRFVHSASDGPKKGVIESSLSEGYWAKAFVAAGRIVPPAEYLGLILTASFGPSLGAGDFWRGVRGSCGLSYKLLGVEAGIELKPEYDGSLGVVRLPAVLSLGFDKKLKVYAGPALTLGAPSLDGSRAYEAQGGFLATAGVEFTPLRFRVRGMDFGLGAELVYNRYVPTAAADLAKDGDACLRAGIGLSLRKGI